MTMAFQVSPGVNITEIDLTTVVPGISTTTGAISGVFKWGPVGERVFINNETGLVSTFGKPTTNNYETFFTAANFLAYSSSLYVARVANTTTIYGSNSALNAIANTGAVANIVSNVVKNRTDYLNVRDGNFDANTLYVAKYPGDLGNSLRVSVCSSINAYSSSLVLCQTQTSNNITGAFTCNVGSSTGTFSFTATSTAEMANNYATTIVANLTVGDLITVGNTSIGTQYLQVKTIGTPGVTVNTSIASFAVGFESVYKLSTNFTANTTVNGSAGSGETAAGIVNLTRSWQFANRTNGAPTTSYYVSNFGNSAAVDTLHVVVVDQDGQFTGAPGSVLEVYQNLSRATDAKSQTGASLYYKTVINDNSAYIWWANDRTGAPSNTALNIANSINYSPLTMDLNGGTDGYSESTVPMGILATGYDLFNSTEQVDISLVLQGKPIGGSTVVNGQTVSNFQLANYLIQNICETRKDCIALISPDDATARSNPGNEATSIINWYGAVTDSTYYIADSSYKYMYDRYNDVYRYVPMNGDIAGLCARTEATNDSWWSPAGFTRGQIKNIVKLRYNPTLPNRDLLYKNSINPIVTFPGQGTVLFGDKTGTKKPSAFDRINVRRLFITLEKAIASASRFSLFEFNDEFTRSQFRNLVIPYLRDVQARRGITDFLVVCDSSNNTAERIDRNEFWGDIYIKPNRSINFIQLNFVAVRTGVQFSTIIGQF